MPGSYKIKKGFDIKLAGRAVLNIGGEIASDTYGVRPPDFPGLTPKLCVKTGDRVKAGTALFFDKLRPEIRFASPVSGTVKDIRRGEQRRILEVVVTREGDEWEEFGKADIDKLSRDEIKQKILLAGLWPAVRQRPYHIVANPAATPKSVFISGFDTAPLAPDLNFIMNNMAAHCFQSGINALARLTDGKVNLVLNGMAEPSPVLKNAVNADLFYFSGKHPAGNTGIHIHHIDPVNKGETVWYVNLQDVVAIGRLFTEGRYVNEKIIALAGPEVNNPRYYKVRSGVAVKFVAGNNLRRDNVRIISGNVLTGTNTGTDGYLGFYDSMITVIAEGKYHEFFGWAKLGVNKFSFSRSFLSSLFRKKEYNLDTNMHGGYRAFVVTGWYEKVVPMDILPMQLFKAILAEDIEAMENLGIYEVAEEDFALCEFICPSKMEIQTIVRQGIDLMIREMS